MDHDVRTQPIGERRARDREGGQPAPRPVADTRRRPLSTISGVGFRRGRGRRHGSPRDARALPRHSGVFFVIQAGLLARRSHRLPNPPPLCRPEQKCRRGLGIDVGCGFGSFHIVLMAFGCPTELSQSIN